MKKFYQLHNKSLSKHKVDNIKQLWDKLKAKGYKGISIQVKTDFKKSSKEENRYHAIFSTNAVDRHGEIVEQNWVLKNFKGNSVYLDSHNYDSIEYIIGKIEKLKANDGKLVGDIIFALSNPRGQLAKDLADGGFLNASSVGFIPLEFDAKFEKIIKSELLEISAVSVPANQEALYEKKYDTSKKERKENKSEDGKDDNKGESEGESDGGNGEECKKEIKSTTLMQINNAVKKEFDIKEKSLQKILTAIKLVNEATKGRSSNEDKASVNAKINCAVKNLLKLRIK